MTTDQAIALVRRNYQILITTIKPCLHADHLYLLGMIDGMRSVGIISNTTHCELSREMQEIVNIQLDVFAAKQ